MWGEGGAKLERLPPNLCLLGPPVHQVKFGAPRRKETDPLNEPVRGSAGQEGCRV